MLHLRRRHRWAIPLVQSLYERRVQSARGSAQGEAPRWVRARDARNHASSVLILIAAALTWRFVSAVTAFLSNVVFPLAQPQQFTVGDRPHLFWDALARWDSGWYFGIAREGYAYVEGGRNNLAFFPTYPVSMGYLGYWLGGGRENYYYAGIIISWAAFAGAMVMLYRLARLDLDRDSSARACVYTAVYPFAFFFGMVYPSSLFLFLSLTAFYAFRTGRWTLAAIVGALVTSTRVNGILIWPALALLLYQHWHHDRRQLIRGAVALALVPAGLLAYSVFVFIESGSLIAYVDSIQRWNYHPGGPPWRPFAVLLTNLRHPYEYLATHPTGPYDLLNGLAALGATVSIPFVWRRFGAGYAMLIIANLALPLSSGEFEGLGRYTSVLFPISLWLATFRPVLLQAGLVASFAMLYMFCQALFVKLYPIF